MTTEATHPVRISQAAQDHLSGSGSWQAVCRGNVSDWPEADALMSRIWLAKPRKDGSVRLPLTVAEADVLDSYTGAWLAAATDCLDSHDASTLGEYNAARALSRRLDDILRGVAR